MSYSFPTFQSAKITSCGEIPSTAETYANVRSSSESGYVVTWRRSTGHISAWAVQLSYINIADHTTWKNFINAVGSTVEFSFILPKLLTNVVVRLIEIPSIPYKAPYWYSAFRIEEIE